MRSAHVAVFCREVTRNEFGAIDIKGWYSGLGSVRDNARLLNANLFLSIIPDAAEREDNKPRIGSLVIRQLYIEEDGQETLIEKIGPVELNLTTKPGLIGFHNKIVVEKIDFPKYGEYRFQILLDGYEISRIPLSFHLPLPEDEIALKKHPAEQDVFLVPIPGTE